MHLLATDRLACPRCGPAFGLILLADRVVDRRVLEGSFGCANCRERFPVRGGFGDFRFPTALLEAEDPGPDDAEGALRLAAMLGVTEGPANLLLMGGPSRHAERLAAMIRGSEVMAVHPGLRGRAESEGVSRLQVGARLPFFSATFRGVAVDATWAMSHLDEVLRVAAPGVRVVVDLAGAIPTGADPTGSEGEGPGPPAAREALAREVMERLREVLLQTDRWVVGVR